MSAPGFLTEDQVLKALCLLLIVFLWNLLGRYAQSRREDNGEAGPDPEPEPGFAARLGGIVHVGCLAVVFFVLFIYLISGVLTHVVSFRYEGF